MSVLLRLRMSLGTFFSRLLIEGGNAGTDEGAGARIAAAPLRFSQLAPAIVVETATRPRRESRPFALGMRHANLLRTSGNCTLAAPFLRRRTFLSRSIAAGQAISMVGNVKSPAPAPLASSLRCIGFLQSVRSSSGSSSDLEGHHILIVDSQVAFRRVHFEELSLQRQQADALGQVPPETERRL